MISATRALERAVSNPSGPTDREDAIVQAASGAADDSELGIEEVTIVHEYIVQVA